MKVIATDRAPGAIGPYSQGYEVNGFIYTSGQIPVDPATGNIPEGISAQAEQSCKNVGAILEAAGVGFGVGRIDAQAQQAIGEDLVAFINPLGNFLPFGRQVD